MSKRHFTPERDMIFAGETFNLYGETTEDAERVAWAKEQETKIKAEAERIERERQKEFEL